MVNNIFLLVTLYIITLAIITLTIITLILITFPLKLQFLYGYNHKVTNTIHIRTHCVGKIRLKDNFRA